MLRRSAKDVTILHHAMERIAVMDIKNLALAQYYETLDDYTKMEAGRANSEGFLYRIGRDC